MNAAMRGNASNANSGLVVDAVVTYVNGADEQWLASYAKYVGGDMDKKRFRSWDNLDLLVAGIRKYMPWIRNVYVVVSGASQLRQFDLDRYGVKVVEHKEFIPKDFLPTFNSNTIEMNMHRIHGLADNFVYFNDDMFPIAPTTIDDFFTGGKPNIHMERVPLRNRKGRPDQLMFADICARSTQLARRCAGLTKPIDYFIRPQHCCLPHNRKAFEQVWKTGGGSLRRQMTRIRRGSNYTQYLPLDYMYFTGGLFGKKLPYVYTSFEKEHMDKSVDRICDYIGSRKAKIICVNDAGMDGATDEEFRKAKNRINEALSHNVKK